MGTPIIPKTKDPMAINEIDKRISSKEILDISDFPPRAISSTALIW
jgi:hypothetical protein